MSITDSAIRLKHLVEQFDAEKAAIAHDLETGDDMTACEFCGTVKHGPVCWWHEGKSVPWPRGKK